MNILNERLSISDDVNIAYDDIIRKFNSKINSAKRIEDWRTGIKCSKLIISSDLEDDSIFIEGNIYYPESESDIEFLKDNNLIYYKFNSYSSSMSFKGIKISTYFYNNKFDPLFYENLQHELNHAYQDLKGYIPKSDSYDRITYVLNLRSNDNLLVKAVAFIEYCNYKFEQDSIVNGYYRKLINEYSNNKISFNESIKNSNFERYLKYLDIYNSSLDKDIDKVMNRLKLSKKNFETKLSKMNNRFKMKMVKAYSLYCDKF